MPSAAGVTRYRRSTPCPICGGYEAAPRGKGVRCHGFTSGDGSYAYCSREERAGRLPLEQTSETFAHRLGGDCRCGVRHDPSSPAASRNGHRSSRIVATYSYCDEQGRELYQVVRYRPKAFRQRRSDGQGRWIWNLDGVRNVPYRLPELREAIALGKVVCICEGEEDVKTLVRHGYAATCNSQGAGKWTDAHSEHLRGAADVVIFGDHDEAGRRHVKQVVASLRRDGLTPRIAQMEDLPEHGDVRDWLKMHTQEDLDRLIAEAPVAGQVPEGHRGTDEDLDAIQVPQWPTLHEAALYGLAGDFVRTIAPHTEADPAALLTQLLDFFGNAIGNGPHCQAEADRHALNENVVLVGTTSKARKGTSEGHVRRLFAKVVPTWAEYRIKAGLSSGEGLISAVGEAEPHEGESPDEAKRLLVIEPEFASTLRVLGRDGNTLSAVLRNAWDGRRLSTMTKNSPTEVSGAHISLVGHITKQELLRYLTSTEAGNGFGNRILWCCVRRANILPEGGTLQDAALIPLVTRLAKALEAAKSVQCLTRDAEAKALWAEVYPELSEGKPGLLGAMTSRAEAHVMRLSGLYALLDHSAQVTRLHLTAALALWDYCEASARFIFGEALGDPLADEILQALRKHPDGMTRTEISQLFDRNKPAETIIRALTLLAEHGLASSQKEDTKGRPKEIWTALSTNETNLTQKASSPVFGGETS